MFVTSFPRWMGQELGHVLTTNNAKLGNINVLHCPLTIIGKTFVKAAHLQGLAVHAADCNTEADVEEAINLGVDQLSANKLELALSVRSSLD